MRWFYFCVFHRMKVNGDRLQVCKERRCQSLVRVPEGCIPTPSLKGAIERATPYPTNSPFGGMKHRGH